jgi:hypothetical protein
LYQALVDLWKDNAQVSSGPAPEWKLGEGGVGVEQLALVSVKRISIGCWVPCIRLINGQKLVPSHELPLLGVIRQLMIFLVAFNLGNHTSSVPSASFV